MRRIFSALIFLVVFSNLAALAQNGFPHANVINRIAHRYMRRHQVPGVSVGVYYKGQTKIFNYGVMDESSKQPITSHTIFEIGSVTKTFTATLLAEQVHRGRIGLHTSIKRFLPQWVSRHRGMINRVTFLELATHTSGLPRVPPNSKGREATYPKRDLYQFLTRWRPRRRIGTHWLYSNMGFGVLGDMVAAVARLSYPKLLSRDILVPLKMQDTSLQVSDDLRTQFAQGYNARGVAVAHWHPPAWIAAGSIRSTPIDMMKFLKANLNVIPLSPQLRDAMQLTHQGFFKAPHNMLQGLAWVRIQKQGVLIIAKDGSTSGFASYIAFNPAHEIGIVILANKHASPGPATHAMLLKLVNM